MQSLRQRRNRSAFASRKLSKNGRPSLVELTSLALRPFTPNRACCGKRKHTHNQCLAKDASCHRCHRTGHYKAQCLSKSTAINETGLDTAFLDATTLSSQEPAWYADIKVGKRNVAFKIDTGAEVTAISQQTYHTLPDAPPPNASEKVHCGLSRKPLQLLCQCHMQLTHKRGLIDFGKKYWFHFYFQKIAVYMYKLYLESWNICLLHYQVIIFHIPMSAFIH